MSEGVLIFRPSRDLRLVIPEGIPIFRGAFAAFYIAADTNRFLAVYFQRVRYATEAIARGVTKTSFGVLPVLTQIGFPRMRYFPVFAAALGLFSDNTLSSCRSTSRGSVSGAYPCRVEPPFSFRFRP